MFIHCWWLFTVLSGTSLVESETSLYTEGWERPKKEAGHSRLVGGSFHNSKGNLHTRLILGVLGDNKTIDPCTHPLNLKSL